MKKFNLFAVAFVAFFTQSVIANAAKAEFPRPTKSEAISNVAIGAERGAKGIIFVDASGAKAERSAKGGVEYPKAQIGTDVAAIGIAKEAYPPMQRGGKCKVEYPQTERGKC